MMLKKVIHLLLLQNNSLEKEIKENQVEEEEVEEEVVDVKEGKLIEDNY